MKLPLAKIQSGETLVFALVAAGGISLAGYTLDIDLRDGAIDGALLGNPTIRASQNINGLHGWTITVSSAQSKALYDQAGSPLRRCNVILDGRLSSGEAVTVTSPQSFEIAPSATNRTPPVNTLVSSPTHAGVGFLPSIPIAFQWISPTPTNTINQAAVVVTHNVTNNVSTPGPIGPIGPAGPGVSVTSFVPRAELLPDTTPITAVWAASQSIHSTSPQLLIPQLATGGEGDEGTHTINLDGIRNRFDTLSGLSFATARAFEQNGTASSIFEVSTSPPTISFWTTGTAGTRRTLWKNLGHITLTRRALGARVGVSLRHGAIEAQDQEIVVTAKINGVAAGSLARKESISIDVITEGDIILETARAGDVLTFEVTQTNQSNAPIQVLPGSRITIEAMANMPMDFAPMVGGIHQGAPLNDGDDLALSEMDIVCVSGMWSGNIASSNTMAHGQKFFDGFVSSAHAGLPDRLNRARSARSVLSLPNGPLFYAYMAATVSAPDGTLAGQSKFDRFASPSIAQNTFVSSRDVDFVPLGGQFTCSAWVQFIKSGGQYLEGYGWVYNQISPGVYETTNNVSGLTVTLRWSGVGARNLTITISTPLAAGDYFAIAHATNRQKDPWQITNEGRQNIQEMVAITFANFNAKIDNIFLDLCNSQFIGKEDLWEVVRLLRPFAPPGMMFNALYPSAEAIEFIATSPSVVSGDIILIEGAGVSVGSDTSFNTLAAINERNRISAGGKHIRLAWLATIAQSTNGAVETNPAIIQARDLFLANFRPGDIFMCHRSGLGTPYLGTPRPLPRRVDGVTSWSS